jgi:multidrug efflux system outer membrane protein
MHVWRAALLALALGACAIGPRYHPTEVVPEKTRVGAGGTTGEARAFFDSLEAARRADTLARGDTVPLPRTFVAESLADRAWLDLLKDTTLIRLVNTAVRQNRDLQVAVARIREFRAEVGVARGPLFPEISANATASTNQAVFGAFPPQKFDAYQITGDLAWELDFWGRIRRGIEAARADLGEEEANQRAVLLSLVSDVSSAYLQLLELDQERAIAQRTLTSRQATLGLARQRFQQGVISELDVRQFEAQVAVPANTLAQTERLRAQQEHQLSQLIGEAPTVIPRGGSLTQAVRALEVPDSVPARLLERRPDVQAAERAYAAATARIGVANAARLPTFSITGYYGTQVPATDRLFTSQGEIYQLQGAVSIPLFTGGRLINESRAARARAEQSRGEYEQTVLTALREASDALVAVRTARDQVTAQETQASALRRALQLAELRYRTGIASYVEVLDAQRGLFDAELSLSQAQLLQLSSAVELYRALGGSWQSTGAPAR